LYPAVHPARDQPCARPNESPQKVIPAPGEWATHLPLSLSRPTLPEEDAGPALRVRLQRCARQWWHARARHPHQRGRLQGSRQQCPYPTGRESAL